MSYFSDFLDDELRLVLSVPVRAAHWISNVDDVQGTDRDDVREEVAAEKAVKKIFSETRKDDFINDVLAEALNRMDYWPEWEKTSATVLDDVPKVMKMLRDRLPADAVAGYQKSVFYIARVVAQAASEQGAEGSVGTGGGFLGKIIDRLTVKADLQAPDNVSETEKAALQKLLAALKG